MKYGIRPTVKICYLQEQTTAKACVNLIYIYFSASFHYTKNGNIVPRPGFHSILLRCLLFKTKLCSLSKGELYSLFYQPASPEKVKKPKARFMSFHKPHPSTVTALASQQDRPSFTTCPSTQPLSSRLPSCTHIPAPSLVSGTAALWASPSIPRLMGLGSWRQGVSLH